MINVPAYVPGHDLLKGKSALVTAAAGGGIGYSTAQRFAEEGVRALMLSDVHPRRLEEAVARLREETGLDVGNVRLMFIESASSKYGKQHIYLCEYIGGEPALASDSEEALANVEGGNTYEPMWLPLAELPGVAFRASVVQEAILRGLEHGWPESVQPLAWKP